jgi:hypothetical protein
MLPGSNYTKDKRREHRNQCDRRKQRRVNYSRGLVFDFGLRIWLNSGPSLDGELSLRDMVTARFISR